MPSSKPAATAPSSPQAPWISHALATVVLLASLLLVLAYWRSVHQNGLRDAQANFQIFNRHIIGLLQQEVINYELLVRGGASLQASLPQPSRSLWQRYVAGLGLTERFPAVQMLGFALDMEPGQLGALRPALLGADWATASVGTAGHEKPHALVLYVAPEVGANLRVTGTDLADHPARRRAMQQVAQTGLPRMSEPVPAPGAERTATVKEFAIFGPVYASQAPDKTASQRLPALRGWVFIQIDFAEFVVQAMRGLDGSGPLRVIDLNDGAPRVAYADQRFLGYRAAALNPDQRPAFVQALPMEALGRHWRVEFESPPLRQVRDSIPGLRITLLGGVLGSLLVFGIALSLARTQSRAQALAEQMRDSHYRSEQRFRSAMEYSAIGQALLDRDGRIVEVNPALVQILGSTAAALKGTALDQHFAAGESEIAAASKREALDENGVSRSTTHRLRCGDGEVRHARLIFASVPGERAEDFASLVQVEDVTERLRAQARVQALNRTLDARVRLRTRELSHANQELEAFAYSVSHDLRAPLRSIDGFSRLLSERYRDVIDASGQDYLRRIRAAGVRMSDLIDALLRMSRVSRSSLQYASVDLDVMAREIIAELANGEPGREVACQVQPGLSVQGDPTLLRTLMENLIGNAWKFTCAVAQGRIEVGRNQQDEIFVRDNGAGFAPEYANKLFRPFQRLHSEQEYTGHGIGLASVKRILERHGGSIRAEAQLGQGATFYFRLPANPDPDHAAA